MTFELKMVNKAFDNLVDCFKYLHPSHLVKVQSDVSLMLGLVEFGELKDYFNGEEATYTDYLLNNLARRDMGLVVLTENPGELTVPLFEFFKGSSNGFVVGRLVQEDSVLLQFEDRTALYFTDFGRNSVYLVRSFEQHF